jgi:putative chitinase
MTAGTLAAPVADELLADNFWLSEFLASQTAVRLGIDNTPDPYHLASIRDHLAPGMQRIRDLLNSHHSGREVGILISSGYRGPALNKAIGGSKTSQHMLGQAADFTAPRFGTPYEVCLILARHHQAIGFDQLVFEGSWVHVSFARWPRGEMLTAKFKPHGVSYSVGIVA